MKKLIVVALLLVAACSGGGQAPAPDATDTGSAASAKATRSAAPSETPKSAQQCIDADKGSGTGTRSENTKACMEVACDQGDKRSCDIVKAANRDAARGSGEDYVEEAPPEPGEE